MRLLTLHIVVCIALMVLLKPAMREGPAPPIAELEAAAMLEAVAPPRPPPQPEPAPASKPELDNFAEQNRTGLPAHDRMRLYRSPSPGSPVAATLAGSSLFQRTYTVDDVDGDYLHVVGNGDTDS